MTPVTTPVPAGFWARHRRSAIAFAAGIAFTGVAGAVVGLCVVEFGLFNTSATIEDDRLTSWALHTTFRRSVRLRASETPLAPGFTDAQVVAGFRQYQADCMACHGGPGVARGDWTKGLEPTPPFLLDAGTRWTAEQLNYILVKGVKMSAMPSWGATKSKAQIAEIVAFLKALPGISPAQFSDWQRRYPAAPAAVATPAAGDVRADSTPDTIEPAPARG